MIIMIDNYDSFTYNIYQYIAEFENDIKVYRNDEITAEEIDELKPDKIIISPGPKAPKDAGNCLDIIKKLAPKYPILGVCLGHQCIGEAFSGKIVHAKECYHGKTSTITLKDDPLFEGITGETVVGRYHSLVVERDSIPDCLEILSETDDNEIMALKHKDYLVYGLQFHPESILTRDGKKIIRNFLNMGGN